MAKLGQDIVDILLLGPSAGRRHLQDSPVLPDVWAAFAAAPNRRLDLLITPFQSEPASRVAFKLAESLRPKPGIGRDPAEGSPWRIAFLQGLVAATLNFDELIRNVVPMTAWWRDQSGIKPEQPRSGRPRGDVLRDLVEAQLRGALIEVSDPSTRLGVPTKQALEHQRHMVQLMNDLGKDDVRIVRYLGLIGAIKSAQKCEEDRAFEKFPDFLEHCKPDRIASEGCDALQLIEERIASNRKRSIGPFIWSLSLNRHATTAADKSVPAIKADAARSLFNISCAEIGWAVLDTGIDQTHPAFREHGNKAARSAKARSRVKGTFDFRNIRDILSVDNLFDQAMREQQAVRITDMLHGGKSDREKAKLEKKILGILGRIYDDAVEGRAVNWASIEWLVACEKPEVPGNAHGTHVAGIIGADWREETGDALSARKLTGVCPDIQLYDFRVVGGALEETEFAVIAALQFIRYMNRRNNYGVIHGVNISLAIPHNVRNYACGRTPVCNEAEELVASGVIVVAAAGNRGYQRYQLADGASFENYAASSITDPGNAENVITVGATHRYWPHTYGVSFFSSRGPTGDGRQKPDLVAPGEKIESTVPARRLDVMDGTSMSAPHVSGAAALLIARHTELKWQPARVKAILCRTATDLGREPSFQGAGMLDVLRALQSV